MCRLYLPVLLEFADVSAEIEVWCAGEWQLVVGSEGNAMVTESE